MHDPVNHPSYYTDGIEVIDYIESKRFPYHLGNAVKYLSRVGKKDRTKTVEDLRKAIWYINRYIKLLEKAESASAGTVDVETADEGVEPASEDAAASAASHAEPPVGNKQL